MNCCKRMRCLATGIGLLAAGNAVAVIPPAWTGGGLWIAILSLVFLAVHLTGLAVLACWAHSERPGEEEAEQVRDEEYTVFGRHLFVISIYLFSFSICAAVALSGLVRSDGALTNLISHDHASMILIVSVGLALLGSLFFVTDAVREKQDQYQPGVSEEEDDRAEAAAAELFDARVFWGRLFFRLAQAVIYTIIVFFLIAFRGNEDNAANSSKQLASLYWLPVIGLLFGMFIKSAEAVVFGVARRLFDAVKALLPGRAENGSTGRS